ncbi:DUF4124 domain-containing protein [Hydrogenophaga sp.]|uniref:DUF4124 domain-containing protein n=1 Tax=Hydrogenophaga sp. TaxID=1904254 RepID=UPI0025C443A6|nr:DUF4124 domain-containing protein [Hydrogenophaga sp.]
MLTVLASGGAQAQWQWIDGSGAKVFSDTAPPPGIPDKNILKRPGARTEVKTPEPATDAAAGAPAAAPAPKLTGRDEQLEAKKKQAEKQAEDAAQAKKKAETEKLAKARAENCERAKRAKTTFDSGIRIATTNAKGEREIMDDKTRGAETKRLDEIIRADCGPMPQAAGPQATVQ